jgi:hypothetical protein
MQALLGLVSEARWLQYARKCLRSCSPMVREIDGSVSRLFLGTMMFGGFGNPDHDSVMACRNPGSRGAASWPRKRRICRR